MSNVVLEIENLSKEFYVENPLLGGLYATYELMFKDLSEVDSSRKLLAVNSVNLRLKKSQILGVIGKNGSGKSTLLKLISRITYPTGGKISYTGSLTPMLEVGTGFHPELSGRENITLNATIHGMKLKDIEPLMDQILEFSEIGRQIDSPIKRYSSGMVVKLGFAIASYIKTDILLLDETLSVGDHAFKRKCIHALKALVKREGRSILVVSHDMDMVREICDEVCVMKKGVLSAPMEAEAAISKYIQDDEIEAWSF
ncbi:MAG: ABC transporter ATP-binding protein [Bdellovibrionota bacterium]|nr:hypothetical protein [Pseudobdellovibrionaceae bacterium]|tara:strand:+ start:46718 stop:47485 length:768 start_codon:yes stop_codon:yes gene_type:complete